MTEPDDLDEDLFADLYEGDDIPAKPAQSAAPVAKDEPDSPALTANGTTAPEPVMHDDQPPPDVKIEPVAEDHDPDTHMQSNGAANGGYPDNRQYPPEIDENYGPIGIKEDGKMFIGGLNWETTDQSLKDYFSQFGEVAECTVMRDGATGRSRGFGFLTFRDPRTVNVVMVKEHYLDGKIIDPKRAIPREEQERTSKIFVGGVSQDATEHDFKTFFMRFGRVIDATLMMDKDTGRPRGFGFVTFDGDAAVDRTLEGPLEILGKPIEVKRAQPRGDMRGEDDFKGGKFGRRGPNDRFSRDGGNQGGNQGGNFDNQQNQVQQNNQNAQNNGMSPAMMAQYWQRMQQYFAMMQQQMAANMVPQQPNPAMAMGGQMNPAMMQQMMQMQAMGRGQSGSPHPQSPGAMPGMPAGGAMNPMMAQQMQQMMQMQGGGPAPGGYPGGPGGGMMSPVAGQQRPGFNAQEQLAFEQQKYEQQQQVRRMQPQPHPQQQYGQYGPAGPTSWEGMYDEVPQPNMPASGPGRGGFGRQGTPNQRGGIQSRGGQGQASTPPVQPSNAPANAPTGPKNAGKPGANYRGGGVRGGHRGFHPYARNG